MFLLRYSLGIVLGIAPRQQGRCPFSGRARSRASMRISASMVFLPSMRSRSRTRFSSSRSLGGAHNVLISLNGCVAAFEHAALPGEELAGGDAVLAGDGGDRAAGLHRVLDEADLLGGGPAAAALDRGDHLDALRGVRIGSHRRTHRRMPMPYRLRHLSARNGVRSRRAGRVRGPGRRDRGRSGPSPGGACAG